MISDEPCAQYQEHITSTEREKDFQITQNGKPRISKADGLVDRYMGGAKEGYMGYRRNPFTWESRMIDQADLFARRVVSS